MFWLVVIKFSSTSQEGVTVLLKIFFHDLSDLEYANTLDLQNDQKDYASLAFM